MTRPFLHRTSARPRVVTTVRGSRALVTLVGAAIAGSALMAGAGQAQAADRNGVCDPGEFCYYYNSDNAGSVSDLPEILADYGTTQPSCYDFKSVGNGQGVCIKNNAASVWNRTGRPVAVYFNSNHGGASQTFAPDQRGNLNATLKNNNASHGPSTPGSRVSSPVPGYGITTPYGKRGDWSKGYHTGDDYAAPLGTGVVAVRSGTVTFASGGALGNRAILHADNGRFYWYCHLQPGSVETGPATAGKVIGRVGVTGNTTGPHLHFEDNASPTQWGTDRKPAW